MTTYPIAIVGQACLLPGAHSPEQLWQLVIAGRSAVSDAPSGHWRTHSQRLIVTPEQFGAGAEGCLHSKGGFVQGFDTLFSASDYALDASLLAELDTTNRWLLYLGRKALQSAGQAQGSNATQRYGAIVGQLACPSPDLSRLAESQWRKQSDAFRHPLHRFSTGVPTHLMCQALGLGLGGFALDAACASSLYAIKLACDELRSGRADGMLAGGICAIDSLMLHSGFTALQALSPRGQSRPFHQDADGLLPSEGGALVVLKRLSDALNDGNEILGLIRGIGLSNDGRSGGFLVPSQQGQIRAMLAAYKAAGLSPGDVSLIECHATGTALGDATEIEAMSVVYQGVDDKIAIGSLKSNLGHLLTASGAAGLIKVLLAMRHNTRPVSLNATPSLPSIVSSPFRVVTEAEPWETKGSRIAAISSFGFGGSNAHLLLEQWSPKHSWYVPAPPPPQAAAAIAVVGLSVKTAHAESLEAFRQQCFSEQMPVTADSAALGFIAFNPLQLRFPPKDLAETLPQQLAILAVIQQVLTDMNLPDLQRVSVLVGMQCDVEAARHAFRLRLKALDEEPSSSGVAAFQPASALGCMPSVATNRNNIQHDFGGASFSVFAEQASGVRALQLAIQALANHEIDMAVAGAVDLSVEPVHASAAAALLPAGQHIPADAACALVLKRLDDAQQAGDTVHALLTLNDAAGHDDWARCIAQRFGHAHAASGLLETLAAILAVRDGIYPGTAMPWLNTGSPRSARVSIGALYGQTSSVVVSQSLTTPASPLPREPDVQSSLQQALALPGAETQSESLLFPAHWSAVSVSGAGAEFEIMVRSPELPLFIPAIIPDCLATAAPADMAFNAYHPGVLQAHAKLHQSLSQSQQHYLQQALDLQLRHNQLEMELLAKASAMPSSQSQAQLPAQSFVHVVAPALAELSTSKKSPPAVSNVLYSREQLEILASGRIADVFGDLFLQQADYPRQVRMPQPPLLLCDRVIALDGEVGSMKTGSIITETDVTADAWYLHQGHMTPGIAVESGQANMLLISWLGADFENRRERVYRLLGCELTFFAGLPKVGETLRYTIQVNAQVYQGDKRLCLFHYDCHVGDTLRLQMRNAQVGFFSDAELKSSAGVLWDAQLANPTPLAKACLDAPVKATEKRSFDRQDVRAFAEGRLADCFGSAFFLARSHTRSPRIPSGQLLMLQTIPAFEASGGPWQRGYCRGEWAVSPDDWFFKSHFKNDPCMPGFLMTDACLQLMAFYLAGLGFTLHKDAWRFEPVMEETFKLVCRRQVVPTSKLLVYEVFVDELIAAPYPTLYADILATVDGLKAFHCRRMGLRLVPDWPLSDISNLPESLHDARSVAEADGFRFDKHSLMACAIGCPTDAFGRFFAIFEDYRRIGRLPTPPYLFISRIASVSEPIGSMKIGTEVVAEYDIQANDWYFQTNGHATMPCCILLEAALQPCGWLVSYVGCTLETPKDLYFRNLDGSAILLQDIPAQDAILITHSRLTSLSRMDSMIIVGFEVSCMLAGRAVYQMQTVFGFFPAESPAEQAGLTASIEELDAMALPKQTDIALPIARQPMHTKAPLLMINAITGFWPKGGRAGLGRIRAEKPVDPGEWFFKAHFFQDPVQPGSLGIEALLQLLQSLMILSGVGKHLKAPHFEAVALQKKLTWKYRGQVLPCNQTITTLVDVLDYQQEANSVLAIAAGSLWVDGKKIYEMPEFAMRMVGAECQDNEEILDPEVDHWLNDHCPNFVVPVLAMTCILDHLVAAVKPKSGQRMVGVQKLHLFNWLNFATGGQRLRTTVTPLADGSVKLTLDTQGANTTSSRYQLIATATVLLAEHAPTAPEPLVFSTENARLIHDTEAGLNLYEQGRLSHGPAFQVLQQLRLFPNGYAIGLLDAAPRGVPQGLLNPVMLDGITHCLLGDNLTEWHERFTKDVVGYPSSIPRLTLFAPIPQQGLVECRVKFLDGGTQPHFLVQLLQAQQLIVEMELVYAVFPLFSLSKASPASRMAFLRDGQFVEALGISRFEGSRTRLTTKEIKANDWLPGSVAKVYGTSSLKPEILAVKDHVGQRYHVHPSAVEVSDDFKTAAIASSPTPLSINVSVVNQEVIVSDEN